MEILPGTKDDRPEWVEQSRGFLDTLFAPHRTSPPVYKLELPQGLSLTELYLSVKKLLNVKYKQALPRGISLSASAES